MPDRREPAPAVPPALVASLTDEPPDGGPDGATWLRALPALAEEVLAGWSLVPAGRPGCGRTALTLPVVRHGVLMVVKIGWPHRESAQEHLALRRWAGQGAVQLIAADPARGALLLEALDADRDLGSVPIDEACAVVGTLLGLLHVPAPPSLHPLSAEAARWTEQLRAAGDVLPRRLAVRALGLIADLTTEPDCDATLVHTDLHYGNVLAALPGAAATRRPWLAIDPKPLAGHPGTELHPVLRNRTDELAAASSLRQAVRRRVEITCETAGIDERSALAWTVVVATLHALWASRDGDSDVASLNIALAKALQD